MTRKNVAHVQPGMGGDTGKMLSDRWNSKDGSPKEKSASIS